MESVCKIIMCTPPLDHFTKIMKPQETFTRSDMAFFIHEVKVNYASVNIIDKTTGDRKLWFTEGKATRNIKTSWKHFVLPLIHNIQSTTVKTPILII